MNRGFTLIETLVYIALLGLMMGGAVVTVYELLSGANTLDTKNTAWEEANFVLHKIEWALGSASDADVPNTHELVVARNTSPTAVDIKFVDTGTKTTVEISENGGITFLPLTTENVTVGEVVFEEIPAVSGAPKGIRATTTIDGYDFAMTKYLRN